MYYAWYDFGPTEYGIELADDLAPTDNAGGVCETFGAAKAALIDSLAVSRDLYRQAILDVRLLRKREVDGARARIIAARGNDGGNDRELAASPAGYPS